MTRTTTRALLTSGLLVATALGLVGASPASADVSAAAVGATFGAATGVLTVTGDNLGNAITVGRNAAGAINVNGGAVPISGGVPSVANTRQLTVNGLGGGDQLVLDETAGALPSAVISGGAGNDTIVGGSGADALSGDAGKDTVDGNGSADQVFLGTDADTFIWNSGDGNDVVEGQAGTDTVQLNGSDASEKIELSANGARLRLSRDVGPAVLDIDDTEQVVVAARGGGDTVTVGDLSGLDVLGVTAALAATGSTTGDGRTDTVVVNGTNGVNSLAVSGNAGSPVVTGAAARSPSPAPTPPPTAWSSTASAARTH